MRQRVLTSSLLMFFMAGVALGQAKKWTPPRLPDGHPDLQGIWTNNSYTPLERPQSVAKEFYTREEALDSRKRRPHRRHSRPLPALWPTFITTSLNSGWTGTSRRIPSISERPSSWIQRMAGYRL
jgi:hypothetical protein